MHFTLILEEGEIVQKKNIQIESKIVFKKYFSYDKKFRSNAARVLKESCSRNYVEKLLTLNFFDMSLT